MEDKIVAFMRSCGIAYTIRGLGRSIVEINEAFFAAKIPLNTNILDIYAEEPVVKGELCLNRKERYPNYDTR